MVLVGLASSADNLLVVADSTSNPPFGANGGVERTNQGGSDMREKKSRCPHPTPTGSRRPATQEARRRPVIDRLKAERIQLRLQRLPGWAASREGSSLRRVRRFPNPGTAASYVAFAASLAESSGLSLSLGLHGGRLNLAVRDLSTGRSEISDAVFIFAEQVG
jgi:hypothetical protein